MIRFYSFRKADGQLTGLVRAVEPGPVMAHFDRDRGGWVEKPELLRHLVEGTTDLEPIDREQADQLAARYGVELDAEPL